MDVHRSKLLNAVFTLCLLILLFFYTAFFAYPLFAYPLLAVEPWEKQNRRLELRESLIVSSKDIPLQIFFKQTFIAHEEKIIHIDYLQPGVNRVDRGKLLALFQEAGFPLNTKYIAGSAIGLFLIENVKNKAESPFRDARADRDDPQKARRKAPNSEQSHTNLDAVFYEIMASEDLLLKQIGAPAKAVWIKRYSEQSLISFKGFINFLAKNSSNAKTAETSDTKWFLITVERTQKKFLASPQQISFQDF